MFKWILKEFHVELSVSTLNFLIRNFFYKKVSLNFTKKLRNAQEIFEAQMKIHNKKVN